MRPHRIAIATVRAAFAAATLRPDVTAVVAAVRSVAATVRPDIAPVVAAMCALAATLRSHVTAIVAALRAVAAALHSDVAAIIAAVRAIVACIAAPLRAIPAIVATMRGTDGTRWRRRTVAVVVHRPWLRDPARGGRGRRFVALALAPAVKRQDVSDRHGLPIACGRTLTRYDSAGRYTDPL